ncbi:MAG: peptidoglycan-binding domain-containing protein [Rhodobacter sp.]|nr:peptidoglycan-binding domain-containing protein [Rhodobacter sp.]
MRNSIIRWVLASAMGLAAPAALAEDLALIVANGIYDFHDNPRGGRAVLSLVPDLEVAGYSVVAFRNLDSATMLAELPGLRKRLISPGRKIFIVAGHVLRDPRDSWLLLSDAERPDGFSMGRFGLSLGELKDLASSNQGAALLAVSESPTDPKVGNGFRKGFITFDIPQGVTVVTGGVPGVVQVIREDVLQPGRVLRDARGDLPDGVRISGFLPRATAFTPADGSPPFPPNPQDQARLSEEALGLTRDQRRDIQQALTLLGFDTRGVDGIFGNRSRQAIADWQASVGVGPTGYLTANQIVRIEALAAQRAAVLRAEADRRRRAEERRDRAYWDQTGANGTEAGLRQYLARYPDGLFSNGAEAQLREIERAKRRAARAEERVAWDEAVMQGTVLSYRQYLRQYPNGRFAQEARARIASLSNPETPPEVVAAAKQEEAQLGLNTFRRQLIEGQLRSLNLEPGRVDGKFTGETRRALRRFQRANNLAVTGYVTRNTIVRLLASAVQP